jgi:hypothetical protein
VAIGIRESVHGGEKSEEKQESGGEHPEIERKPLTDFQGAVT